MTPSDRLDLLAELVAISIWRQTYADHSPEAAARVADINRQLDEGSTR